MSLMNPIKWRMKKIASVILIVFVVLGCMFICHLETVSGNGHFAAESDDKIKNRITKKLANQGVFNPDHPKNSEEHGIVEIPENVDVWKVDVSLYNLEQLETIYLKYRDEIETRVESRMAHVRAFCETKKFGQFKASNKYNSYAFNEIKVTWCPVFKCGSTTWKDYFIERFYPQDHPPPYIIRILHEHLLSKSKQRYYGGKRRYINEGFDNVRFTVVRNPLSRIVSHLKNSQKPMEMHAQRDVWIKRAIINNRKHKTIVAKDEQYLKELEDFYETVSNPDKYVDISPENPYLNPPYPDISELIGFIWRRNQTGKYYDGHWAPASEWCDICMNKFDYVIKLENGPWETFYLLEKLGLWESRSKFLAHHNSSGKKNNVPDLSWFGKQLSEDHKTFLNAVYEIDQLLFDYAKV